MHTIITNIRLYGYGKEKNKDILDNFNMTDLVVKPDDAFKKYFKGSDEEYDIFLKQYSLKLDVAKINKDILIKDIANYIERFHRAIKQNNNLFDEKLNFINSKQFMKVDTWQENIYDFNSWDKEEWQKFINNFEYKSSSILSFMRIDDELQRIKTYNIDKNLFEAKELFDDLEEKDNYIRFSVENAKSKVDLLPKYGLAGLTSKSKEIRIDTINFTEMRNIYLTAKKIGINDIVTYREDNSSKPYTPNYFLKQDELDKEAFENLLSEIDASRDTKEAVKPKEIKEDIVTADNVKKGSLKRKEGIKTIKEKEEKENVVEAVEKTNFDDINNKIIDDIELNSVYKEIEEIKERNDKILANTIDEEMRILQETKEKIDEAYNYTKEALNKGASINSALESVKQTYRKYPKLPLFVAEKLRLDVLAENAKNEILKKFDKNIKTLSTKLEEKNRQIEDKNTTISDLKQENDVYKNSIKEIEDKIELLAEQLKYKNEEIEILDLLTKEQDKKIEELQKKYDAEKDEKEKEKELRLKAEEQLKAKDDEIRELKEKIERQMKQSEEQLKAKDDYIDTLKGSLDARDERIEFLNTEIDDLRAKNKELSEQTRIDTNKIRDLNKLIDKLREENKQIEEYIKLKTEQKELRKQNIESNSEKVAEKVEVEEEGEGESSSNVTKKSKRRKRR